MVCCEALISLITLLLHSFGILYFHIRYNNGLVACPTCLKWIFDFDIEFENNWQPKGRATAPRGIYVFAVCFIRIISPSLSIHYVPLLGTSLFWWKGDNRLFPKWYISAFRFHVNEQVMRVHESGTLKHLDVPAMILCRFLGCRW